ncbi:transcriptional regulator, TetR family [Corynebacterium pollutisoli]|uniref:Transcriptional regulator, TetR family n=1 Tax=Corynebacterium pollutisoli TaxID=1610489 RepID=A0A1X7JUT0_9CORY|nr:TetR family transcriptional regulator [Corynebacterium pollutisoli]SMG32179.1 transcriptional regulator, TetR family [Corynebacterium pollutisoli]
MSGLRESKKAATRAQIARAAAALALDQGADALTIAAVSEAAGVSPRTFHNYFTAMDEALLEFMVGRVSELIDRLRDAPADAGLFDAIQWVIIEGLRGEAGVDTHLDSFASLFRISDLLLTMRGAAAIHDLDEQLRPLFDKLRARTPNLGPFEAEVAIRAAAAVAQTALELYFTLPEPKDPAAAAELIRRAFAVVRLA